MFATFSNCLTSCFSSATFLSWLFFAFSTCLSEVSVEDFGKASVPISDLSTVLISPFSVSFSETGFKTDAGSSSGFVSTRTSDLAVATGIELAVDKFFSGLSATSSPFRVFPVSSACTAP